MQNPCFSNAVFCGQRAATWHPMSLFPIHTCCCHSLPTLSTTSQTLSTSCTSLMYITHVHPHVNHAYQLSCVVGGVGGITSMYAHTPLTQSTDMTGLSPRTLRTAYTPTTSAPQLSPRALAAATAAAGAAGLRPYTPTTSGMAALLGGMMTLPAAASTGAAGSGHGRGWGAWAVTSASGVSATPSPSASPPVPSLPPSAVREDGREVRHKSPIQERWVRGWCVWSGREGKGGGPLCAPRRRLVHDTLEPCMHSACMHAFTSHPNGPCAAHSCPRTLLAGLCRVCDMCSPCTIACATRAPSQVG